MKIERKSNWTVFTHEIDIKLPAKSIIGKLANNLVNYTYEITELESLRFIITHQKKVIDRLSRKIQRLNKNLGFFKNGYAKSLKVHLRKDEKIEELTKQNEFLRQRENKLQMIEQMFKSGSVDLRELDKLVRGKI